MTNTKPTNPWLSHVKAYQEKNKCTYTEALKSAKATYKIKPAEEFVAEKLISKVKKPRKKTKKDDQEQQL